MSQTLCCSPCQVGDQFVTHCDLLSLSLQGHMHLIMSPLCPSYSPRWPSLLPVGGLPQCSFLCIWSFPPFCPTWHPTVLPEWPCLLPVHPFGSLVWVPSGDLDVVV